MRAIVVTEHGGPEVLAGRTDWPDPHLETGRMLIDVTFAGVNYRDIQERKGLIGSTPPLVCGTEGIGVVREVAAGVTEFAAGDRVAWTSEEGSYAEVVLVRENRALPVPAGVSDEAACAAAMQALTAHTLACSVFPVSPGDAVLVHAAAGGVGLLLTQIVKMRGGIVIATVSTPEKAALARAAGADHVLSYEDVPDAVRDLTNGKGVAVVYDGVGRDTFEGSLTALRKRGLLVMYGNASGPAPPYDLRHLSPAGSLFVTRPAFNHYSETRDELLSRSSEVFQWVADGKLELRIERIYDLEQAADAHRDLEGRRTTGKLLLAVR